MRNGSSGLRNGGSGLSNGSSGLSNGSSGLSDGSSGLSNGSSGAWLVGTFDQWCAGPAEAPVSLLGSESSEEECCLHWK